MSKLGHIQKWSDEEKLDLFWELQKHLKDKINAPKEEEQAEYRHISEYIPQITKLLENKGAIDGLATGYTKLDSIMGGMSKGELIVVGGSTGTGKTMFAINVLVQALLKETFTTLVVSMEMTRAQFGSRIEEILRETKYAGELAALPIYFHHHAVAEPTIGVLRRLIEKMKEEVGCDLIVIDHLHCWSRSLENQANELGIIVRDLKKIALDLEVVVLLVSHIRKKPSGAAYAESTMDDLRGSSFIAQDADMVVMLSRDRTDPDKARRLVVDVQKNRNKGKLDKMEMSINDTSHRLLEIYF